jgi:hypothetical protein
MMPISKLQTNRRINRSCDVQTALSFQLSATAERAEFTSIVLADENGLVMASSGNPDVCEHMAALSPILSAKMRLWHGELETNRGKVQMSVAPLRVEGNLLYLAAAEGRKSYITKELFFGGRGVTRILH